MVLFAIASAVLAIVLGVILFVLNGVINSPALDVLFIFCLAVFVAAFVSVASRRAGAMTDGRHRDRDR